MWESILNYSVYSVSHCGNGRTITDGGPSATTQQAKEGIKVKRSSKGHIRKHFWEGWLCPWEAITSLIISVSTKAAYQLWAPAICYRKHWQDQWKQAPLPQFECDNNLLNEVKHDAEHTHLNFCWICLSQGFKWTFALNKSVKEGVIADRQNGSVRLTTEQ